MLGLNAIGVRPFAVGGNVAATALGGVTTLYLSDRGWISRPADALANVMFLPRVKVPIVMERMLPLAPETPARVGLNFGEMTILNTDGWFDDAVQRYAIDGRRVVVRVGRPGDGYAGFSVLFDGTASSWGLADDETLRVSLRDDTWRLEIPVQTSLYGGTGGLDGGADLRGKPKPLVFGAVENIAPPLVDPASLVYQVHDGPIQAVSNVHDQGVALTYAGDVADIAATSVSAGQFNTQLSGGYIRLGSTPAGLVTADVAGDKTGGVYADDTAYIALRLIRTRGGFNDGEIDGHLFERLRNQQPAAIGLFIGTEPVLLSEVLDRLMAVIGGWWSTGRLGRIQVGRVDAPGENPVAHLTTVEILSLDKVAGPPSINPPNWRRRVEYQRNWTVQTSDLAGSVTAARRAFLAEVARVSTAFDTAVSLRYLTATDPPPVPGLYQNQADADAEAGRLLSLFKTERQLFRVTVKLIGYLIEPGATVKITWPRHGLANGVHARVIGSRIDGDRNETVLTVFV